MGAGWGEGGVRQTPIHNPSSPALLAKGEGSIRTEITGTLTHQWNIPFTLFTIDLILDGFSCFLGSGFLIGVGEGGGGDGEGEGVGETSGLGDAELTALALAE